MNSRAAFAARLFLCPTFAEGQGLVRSRKVWYTTTEYANREERFFDLLG